MPKILLFLFLVSSGLFLQAQNDKPILKKSPKDYIYDTDLLTPAFHRGRREALRKLMQDNSVAVVFSSPVRNRANDVNFEYHQNPNMYYLSGVTEPHSMLLIFSDSIEIDSVKTNEMLFVQSRNPASEIWDGRRLGESGSEEVLGFKTVRPNKDFSFMDVDFSRFKNIYHALAKGDIRDDSRDRGDLFSLVKHFKEKADSALNIMGIMGFKERMAKLRQKKLNDEIALMVNAIDFTCEAQMELMRLLKPGVQEFQSEAIIEYVFKKNGAEYPGFPSILGGGENSCVLHYVSNRKRLQNGDLLVSDIGAEYHGYTADVTRTLPVSGKFTKNQKEIYAIVLEAQMAGINQCKQGRKFWDPGVAAKIVIQNGLMKLGVIQKPEDYRKYFMHGTSHYLGLDVHDVGLYGDLQPGEVITVEPGIYIPEGSDCDPKWWNIGIRIEDDVLITAGKPEVLSDCVPKKIAEVEAIMEEESKLFKHKK